MRDVYRTLQVSVMLLLLACTAVFAQQKAVTGTVKDPSGVPMPGVNVVIKGTTTGTVTDVNGNFTINAAENDVLVVSFIGYKAQEVPVGTQTSIAVELSDDLTTLGEVVVVGYGVQDKKVVTGATVAVKTDDLMKTNSLQLGQALQGQTPGVQITSTSGQPGEPMKVRVRGTGTLGDAEPLYLVDGVPTTDISYLNSANIERIDVLKDAASAAIYGARGANGVVLITTKKGKAGSSLITFDAYYGVQNAYRKLPMLNSQEYATIMNEASINSGQAPVFTTDQIANLKTTDWQDVILSKNAPMQNYSLGFSGGSENSTFSSAMSYFSQDGIIGADQGASYFDRLTFTINSQHKVFKDIVKFGENLTYSNVTKSGVAVGGIYSNALRPFINASPVMGVYDENGDYAKSPMDALEANPLGYFKYNNINKTVTDKIVGDVYAEATYKGFTFRSDFGADLSFNNYRQYGPQYLLTQQTRNDYSFAIQNMSRVLRWNWDNTLRYNKTINEQHNIEILVGTTAQELGNSFVNARKEGLTFDDFEHAVLNNATSDSTIQVTGNTSKSYSLFSYFGRINYNFNEKYLLSATIRRDGSSNFGPNNRYAIFPSVSAGWVLTEESFLQGIPQLNFLKLRASWGQNGNDRILPYAYMATLGSQYRDYYFGSGEDKAVGTSPVRLPNPDLKWETSEQIDIGFDATLFNNLIVSVDFYNKKTKDWLVIAPIPDLAGAQAPWINGGDIQNRGVEIQASYNRKLGDVSFTVSGNVAFNKNEVTRIANDEGIIHGDPNTLFNNLDEMNRAQVGHPVGFFYGLQTAGIFQNDEEIAAYSKDGNRIQPYAVPGDVKFVDRNGDGVIDDKDKTQIGNPNPSATYGLNFNVAYKGFDFSVYTYGSGGQQNVFGYRPYDTWYANYTTDILGRWHGEGTSNRLPRVTRGDERNENYKQFSDLYVQNATFLRIKSINVGYDFTKLLPSLPFRQFRVYVSANNLFTFTKYKGLDPEVGFAPQATSALGTQNTQGGLYNAFSGYNLSSGVDVGFYPQPRTFMAGVSIKL